MDYVTIKIRREDKELLERLAGDKPITRFVHELLEERKRRLDAAVESAVGELESAFREVDELFRSLRVEVLRKEISAEERGDVVAIRANVELRIPDAHVRKLVVRALG